MIVTSAGFCLVFGSRDTKSAQIELLSVTSPKFCLVSGSRDRAHDRDRLQQRLRKGGSVQFVKIFADTVAVFEQQQRILGEGVFIPVDF